MLTDLDAVINVGVGYQKIPSRELSDDQLIDPE